MDLFTIGGQWIFTKITFHEIPEEFLQKVIQLYTNRFEKDWTINRADITHKRLCLQTLSVDKK